MKTLVVDDELVSRNKMQKIMESYGESEAVDNGHTAITTFRQALENRLPFDLITLDISMPDMDGTEVLFEMREIEEERNIPREKQVKILMVTSHSDKDTVVTSIQAECDDYIVKPFNKEIISEKIGKIKSGKRLAIDGIDDILKSSSEQKPSENKSNILKTLVVDDELVSRKKMQKIMESYGESEAVDNGHTAITTFRQALDNRSPFDLITLDISMPDMDGTEVLFEMREIEKEKNIPREKQVKILMVTSHTDKDAVITSIQAECDDYIVKPFNKEIISEKIGNIRSGKRLTRDGIDDILKSPS
jgi:two-component system, chemotaxis family, chemotaxis protein CheY